MKLGKNCGSYSPRSAASLKEEQRLEADIQRCAGLITGAEAEERRLEEHKKECLAVARAGGSHDALSKALAEIEDVKRRLAAYKEAAQVARMRLAEFREKISPRTEQRCAQQEKLALLVRKRLALDKTIEETFEGIRQLVAEREKLSEEMRETADRIELQIRDWDEARFTELVGRLPQSLVTGSQQWAAWLVGDSKAEGVKAFVVIDEKGLILPETLASAGIYKFGDIVYLSEEHARPLTADLPNPHYKPAWNDGEPQFILGRIMPKAEFDEVRAQGKKEGNSIEMAVFHRNLKRRETLEKAAMKPAEKAMLAPAQSKSVEVPLDAVVSFGSMED